MTCSGSYTFTGTSGCECVDQALRPKDDTVTVHGHTRTESFHGKRTQLGDINAEPLRSHLKEPAACPCADTPHREHPRDAIHHGDRLVVHPAYINNGCGSMLSVCEIHSPLRVYRQFFLYEVSMDRFPYKETAITRSANSLHIFTGDSRF